MHTTFIIYNQEKLTCVRRQVTLEEATTKATEMSIMFMETSAKAGHNVKSLFKKIAMSLPGMEKETQQDTSQSMCIPLACLSLIIKVANFIPEIDVTTPAQVEVPEASQCNC